MLSGIKRLLKPGKQAKQEKEIIVNIKVKQKENRRLNIEKAEKINKMSNDIMELVPETRNEVSKKLTKEIMDYNKNIEHKMEENNRYIQEQLDKAKYLKLDVEYIKEMIN
ncbi:hypothetical protein P9X10_00355 [Bacillus cereus]|nr:hypothetical protein [Bacillus cereus]